jgi:hypothetical protein
MLGDLFTATAFVLFCAAVIVAFGLCLWWCTRLFIAIAVWALDRIVENHRGW